MPRAKVTAITRKVLGMILAASRETHPNEFICALRAEDGVITEILLMPGAIQGDSHAIFNLHNLPVDFSIVGIAHSHPIPDDTPSEADLHQFSSFGSVQIIAFYPYEIDSWTAYSREGEPIRLEVV